MATTFGFARQAVVRLDATLSGTPSQATISLTPTTVLFTAAKGDIALQTEAVTIENTGGGNLSALTRGTIVYGSGSGWISSAVISSSRCLITVNPAGLDVGTYTATVPVTDTHASNTPQDITVSFIITGIVPLPLLSFGAADLTRVFTATEGGANPTAQTLTVSNDQGGTTLAGVSIINVSHAWFNVSYSAPTVTIAPNITGIVASNYTGSFQVDSTNASNTPRTVSVTVNVSAAAQPQILLTPAARSFTATAGGANPSSNTVAISEQGGGALGTLGTVSMGTIVYTQGTGWADTSSYAAGVLTIRPVTGTLGAGTYNCVIPINATLAGNSGLGVAVQFVVSGVPNPPVISLSAGFSPFSATEGGANPASQNVTVQNSGGGSFVNLRVLNASATWINPSLVSTTLTVAPVITGLVAGTYNGTFDLTADNAATLQVAVTLNLSTAASSIVLTPATPLTFNATSGGGNPSNQVVAISNGGGGSLGTLGLGSISYGAGPQGWAATTSLAGTDVTVRCATGTLAPGSYPCTIPVTSTTAPNSPQNIQVTFVVASGGTGGILPAFLPPTGMSWNPSLLAWSGVPTGCTITKPAFAGTVYSVANATDMNTRITQLSNGTIVDGDVIEISADLTGTFQIPARPAVTSGFVEIRTSGHGSLPAYSSNYMTAGTAQRVDPAIHGALLRKIKSNVNNGNSLSFATNARGYWLTGIECVPDSPSRQIFEAGIRVGATVRDLVFASCYIHSDPATGGNLSKGFWIQGQRITIAHSVVRGIAMPTGNEHQGIYLESARFLIAFNTEVDSVTENIFAFPSASPGNEDLAFIRCYITKQEIYNTSEVPPAAIADYRKNLFELKDGERVLLYGCYFLNYDKGAQTRCGPVFTPDTQTWNTCRDVTIMCCIFDDINGGTANWSAQGSHGFPNLGTQRIEMLHCDWRNVTPGSFSRFELGGASGPSTSSHQLPSIRIHHNAFDHNQWWVNFEGIDLAPNFYYCDNVFKRAVSFGPVRSSEFGNNDAALNGASGIGNWQCRKSVGITGSAALGNLTLAPHLNALTTSTDLYTNAGASDWTIRAGSAWKGYATDGTDPGPAWALLNTATANVRP